MPRQRPGAVRALPAKAGSPKPQPQEPQAQAARPTRMAASRPPATARPRPTPNAVGRRGRLHREVIETGASRAAGAQSPAAFSCLPDGPVRECNLGAWTSRRRILPMHDELTTLPGIGPGHCRRSPTPRHSLDPRTRRIQPRTTLPATPENHRTRTGALPALHVPLRDVRRAHAGAEARSPEVVELERPTRRRLTRE